MARSSLQLAAGLLVLAGLLGLSTALIAEVREEVLQADEQAPGDPAREVTQPSQGLPVPQITLLDPTQANLTMERTGEGFLVTGPSQLHIAEGGGIRPGPFTVDGSAKLELAAGWDSQPGQLTCTDPCQLWLDGTRLQLPADTSLQAPDGRGLGLDHDLEPGTQIDLPQQTRVELPVVRFPAGTTLDLSAGARGQLPAEPDQRAALLEDPVRLPPGTVIERASATGSNEQALADMLGRASQPDPPDPPDPRNAEEPSIAITETPDTIAKGQPFTVAGRVDGPAGDPASDHPVTVYANATKPAPGMALHAEPVTTDETGRFEARVVLPEAAPTRPYHILAHAHPRLDTQPPLAGAWTDPLVPVEGEANLTLDLPETTGTGTPLGLAASLADAHGAPIPNQTVVFSFEGGQERFTARTDGEGQALTVIDDGLPFTGNYTVHARFPGTGNITADEDETTIEAVDARIQAPATHRAPRGSATQIEGRVVTDRTDPGRVRLEATYAGNITATANTDPNGAFVLDLPVPPWLAPGDHYVDLEAPAVDARHRLVLTAQAPIRLDVPTLGPQPVGSTVPLPVDVGTGTGEPVPGLPVEIQLPSGETRSDLTDHDGRAHLAVPLPDPGTHTVEIRADTPDRYTASDRSLAIEAAPLTVDADPRLTPGRTVNTSLTLTVDDTPLPRLPVRLVGPGFVAQARTDLSGTATMQIQAPDELGAGTVRANLTLPSREVRNQIPVRVLERPDVTVTIDQQPREGQPLEVLVTATTEAGPTEGVPIVARTQGAFEARAQAFTDADGRAHLTLTGPDDAEGPVQVDVLAEATGSTAAVAETASTQATASPTPWGWALAGLVAAGLATVAGLRHHRSSPADSRPDPEGPHLSLALDPAETTQGPVWHPGEATSLSVQLTTPEGHPLPEADIDLEGPDGTHAVKLDEQGQAEIAVPPRGPGRYTYRARYEADGTAAETVLELRVVDYREEIDRRYRRLHEASVRLGLIQPDATPRELGDALGPPADEMARLFERFDYAPHPVDREDYERFIQLLQEADPRGAPR